MPTVKLGAKERITRLALLWVIGTAGIALVTWVCYRLGLDVAVTELGYLTIIIAVSLLDSLISSLALSIVAIACLDYFFIVPIFSFRVQFEEDLPLLSVFVIISILITSFVRRLHNLSQAAAERAQLLDLMHDTVIIRDMDDVILYWNRGAEHLYGWTARDAIGRNSRELLQTVFPDSFEAVAATLLRTGRWEGELVRQQRDGTPVTVSSRWELRRDERGTPIGTIETNNDITERVRIQEVVRRTQAACLAEAQRLSSTGSFGWDLPKGEFFWSEESYRIFDFEPGVKLTLDLILQRVHPDDVAGVRREIDRSTRDRTDLDIEHRLLMSDGSVKQLHVVAHVVIDEPGQLRFAGAMMDITQSRQSEEQMQRMQSELARATRVTTLGQLTASIAHEVNQPLAAIVTQGEACQRWLNNEAPKLDEVASSMQWIISDAKRASAVVQRVRALMRKDDQQRLPVDLNGLIEDTIPLVARDLTDHRIVLRVDLGSALPAVSGDRIQLQQVILNLVMNGIQAMAAVGDRPRELTVRSQLDGEGAVLVEVRDTGVGIDAQAAGRLFDAFYTTKPQGMGMGLAICRSIIDSHEGRIWAENAADGRGAVFRFRVPPLRDAT